MVHVGLITTTSNESAQYEAGLFKMGAVYEERNGIKNLGACPIYLKTSRTEVFNPSPLLFYFKPCVCTAEQISFADFYIKVISLLYKMIKESAIMKEK